MSSTTKFNRMGDDAIDNYPTPRWCVETFVPHLLEMFPGGIRTALEPAVGDGALLLPITDAFGDITWVVNDIRPECAGLVRDRWTRGEMDMLGTLAETNTGDFLASEPGDATGFDLVITNPPYARAMEFLQHALKFIHDHGRVIMLLRAGFLQAIERHAWLVTHQPDRFVFGKRPSFDVPHPPKCSDGGRHRWGRGTEKGARVRCESCGCVRKGQDSAMYEWMVWTKGPRSSGRSVILHLPRKEIW